MKKYPLIDWKELTEIEKEIFDIIEEQILWNNKVLEDTEIQTIDVIAYNSAFSLISDNRLLIAKI